MKEVTMETRIGISGWRYPPWRGTFYPEDLAQKNELYFASRQLSSIEINGSFYSTQSPASYKAWYSTTPDHFIFSVKGPRYITHIRRLNDIALPLANFFGSGVLHLKEKLGPFLWQFPPSFRLDEDKLANFFAHLPKTEKQAVQLAKKADRLDPDYPAAAATSQRHLRHAIEVRHHSFENPDFIKLLRDFNIALVLADTAGKWPYMEDATADFMYLRLHGDEELYASGYAPENLNWWSDRIKKWQAGSEPRDALTMAGPDPHPQKRDVFVYFDNDLKVRAPVDAKSLMHLLHVDWKPQD
ncbi:DUF72 domain-containing protein [Bdellovibrio sp. NC01]|uniref:DUF72 domain-containing protein n=1 Tax=Bdellovibrio sp. NC01 TaxID=2220073 RepID=UPI001FEDCB25|nr:DUF72 domain-containing protein [Bdellovibrio sp. NC01]